MGTALNDRPSLFLSGEVYPFALALDSDLRIENLPTPITADGQTEDWAQQPVTPHSIGAGPGNPESRDFSARYRIGRDGNAVYALFEVSGARILLRDPERTTTEAADHLEVAVVTPDDEFLRFAIDARGSVERESFDLAEVVGGCVEGYRLAHANCQFEFDAGLDPLPAYGSPDLIAQMLDKLAANAVEFSAPNSTIRLGLYIVRLIAGFHNARASARNRDDASGVEIRIEFPRADRRTS